MTQPDMEIKTQEKLCIPAAETSTTHRELSPGTHLLITRRTPVSPEDKMSPVPPYSIKVAYVGTHEAEIINEIGEEAAGFRHFVEHIAARTFMSPGTARLLDSLEDLSLRRIVAHARTGVHGMEFSLKVPQIEDYGLVLTALEKMTSGRLLNLSTQIAESAQMELPRIASEILRAQRARSLAEFIASKVYTEDSVANVPSILGEIPNLQQASPELLKKVLELVTKGSTMIIQVENPPPNITDEMIAQHIDLTERQQIPSNGYQEKNTYVANHGWVHIEHPYGPIGAVEARASLPLEIHNPKERVALDILFDILDGPGISPLTRLLQYDPNGPRIYDHHLHYENSSDDLQISALLAPHQVAQFMEQILDYVQSESINTHVRRAFNTVIDARLRYSMNTIRSAETAAAELVRTGSYIPLADEVHILSEITVEDVLTMVEKLRQNSITSSKLLTFTRDNQPQIKKVIERQKNELAHRCPLLQTFTEHQSSN